LDCVDASVIGIEVRGELEPPAALAIVADNKVDAVVAIARNIARSGFTDLDREVALKDDLEFSIVLTILLSMIWTCDQFCGPAGSTFWGLP
jgi:hypothetical protein